MSYGDPEPWEWSREWNSDPEEYWPIKPDPGPHPDDREDPFELGYWVSDGYGGKYYVTTWLGDAIAAEDERIMYEEIAEQHYRDEARKAESHGA